MGLFLNEAGQILNVTPFSADSLFCCSIELLPDVGKFQILKIGDLIPIKEEQKAIEMMVKFRKGGISLRKIADLMKKKGFDVSHAGVKKIINGYEERLMQV